MEGIKTKHLGEDWNLLRQVPETLQPLPSRVLKEPEMEGTRTWCGVTFISRKAVLFWVGANLLGCFNGVSQGLSSRAHSPPPHSRLTFDLSSQLRYQIVMNSLFLISIQKTVSRGPWVEGVGSGEGQEMSHRGRESQKINLFSPKERSKGQGSPFLGLDSKTKAVTGP